MTFGLTGWSLLLSMIFSVLTVYRYYRNGDRHKKVHDDGSNVEEEKSAKVNRNKDAEEFNVEEI